MRIGAARTLVVAALLAAVPCAVAAGGPAAANAAASVRCPVDFFRELLALDPDERPPALTNRPPEVQQQILAKVREYAALPADERELRLRATELRWYLLPLLSAPANNQAALLARVPPSLRKLVEARLVQWRLYPPALQKQLLEDDRNTQLYLQFAASTPSQRATLLRNLTPAERQNMERKILYPPGLDHSFNGLDQFFDLTTDEKSKVLASLSETERQQIAKTLQVFEDLPRPQRLQCLRSFAKFAGLSLPERQQFLRNAEQWEAMTPTERDTWRKLVQQAQAMPPLPPGLGGSPPPPDPRQPAASAASVVTNGR